MAKKPYDPSTGYAYADKDGRILLETASTDKNECYHKLWGEQTCDFREMHWKNEEATRRAFRKMGYKLVKVKVVPQ